MPKTIQVRECTEEECQQLEKLTRSRTAEKRLVERATIIVRRLQGDKSVTIAGELGVDPDTITRWVKRFNAEGVAGLADLPGRGRKPDYNEQQRGQMMAVARTKPQALGQPYSCWSLRRLCSYLKAEEGIAVSRAQLGRILEAEGLRWYQEQTYFTERPDPQFAEKRGR